MLFINFVSDSLVLNVNDLLYSSNHCYWGFFECDNHGEMTIDIKELKALISLLDDTDNEIINVVSSNLLNQGPEAIPGTGKGMGNYREWTVAGKTGDSNSENPVYTCKE